MKPTQPQQRVLEVLGLRGSLRGKDVFLRSGLDFIAARVALREVAEMGLARYRPGEHRELWFELTARGRVELRGTRKRVTVGVSERVTRFRRRQRPEHVLVSAGPVQGVLALEYLAEAGQEAAKG